MLQKFIDAANANPAIIGLILCGIMLVAVLILTLDRRTEKKRKARIRQLKEAVETKERLIVHQQQRIKDLKTELFALGMDKKISEEKLTKRIEKLETEKKQFLKWGAEK